VRTRLLDGLDSVDGAAWDAIAGDDDPFVEHGFLHALETSGSVGDEAGWRPRHVTVWEDERLVGALPCYEKDHSFGEYIFDWAWADAARRIGIRYYPKLVSMVPVTPATGHRLLIARDADRPAVASALVRGLLAAADDVKASSAHMLFLTEEEQALVCSSGSMIPRLTEQFHWHNRGYSTFENFLADLRSEARKQIRRERRRVAESGLTVEVKPGAEMRAAEWDAMRDFYHDTCARKGSHPYLTGAFFDALRDDVARTGPARRAVIAMAYDGERPVAGTLNFEKGKHLYGRYWGALADYDMLHFELCYYRLIDRAIDQRMTRFEAGAQGMHKLKRGLVPSPVHSAHWVRHPVLAGAVAEYLPREAAAIRGRMDELALHGPFRRG
jgi:hypothetical protein